MTGKAVGHLDFVHSPPHLPSGQSTPPPTAIQLPRNQVRSFLSCYPSIQMLHNSTPFWTGLCAGPPHQIFSLGQLARPSTSGFAVIILRSFRDSEWPSALLKTPELRQGSRAGVLPINDLNSRSGTIIHWTKWNALDNLQAQRSKKECCHCLRTMFQETFINGFSGRPASHLVLLRVTPLILFVKLEGRIEGWAEVTEVNGK